MGTASRFWGGLFAVLLTGWLPSLGALGLGPVSLHSVLGEPLDATVPVTGAGTTPEPMSVAVASREAFARIGLERTPALAQVSVTVEEDGTGAVVLRLASAAAMNEPLLAMVLELRRGDSTDFHEVVLPLDPAAPAGIHRPIVTRVTPPAPRTPRVPVVLTGAGGDDMLWVRSGDTLYGIAERVVAARGGQVAATALALYRANPGAFIAASADRILAGVRLTLPDEIAAVAPAEARRQLAEAARAARGVIPVAALPAPDTLRDSAAAAPQEIRTPEAPADGGFRLSLLSAEEEAALLPRENTLTSLRSREEIARLHDDVRAQIAAMESERAQRMLAARSAPAPAPELKLAVVEAIPSARVAVSAPAPRPALTAGLKTSGSVAASGMLDDTVRLLELAASWRIDPLTVPTSTTGLFAIAALLVVATAGVAVLHVRRRDTRSTPARVSRPASAVGAGTEDPQSDLDPLNDVSRPGAGFRGADWLECDVESFDLSQTTGEGLEHRIEETLSASDAFLRHGYDDVAEALVRGLVAACPQSTELRVRLLEVLHAAGRRAAFVTEAHALRELVGETDPEWRRVRSMGAELAPPETRLATGNGHPPAPAGASAPALAGVPRLVVAR